MTVTVTVAGVNFNTFAMQMQAGEPQPAVVVLAQAATPADTATTIAAAQADDYGTGAVSSPVYCPRLSTTMQKGAHDASTGGQVSELQAFITSYYNLDENIVVGGYFGNLTHKYTVQFQQEQGLPTFGIAGSLTRGAIARVCGGNTAGNFSASPTSGQAPLTVIFRSNTNETVDFGDGTSGTMDPVPGYADCAISPPGTVCNRGFGTSHTYTSSGTYTAKLYGSPCPQPLPGTVNTFSNTACGVVGTATIKVGENTSCQVYSPAPCPTGYHLVGGPIVNGCQDAPQCVADISPTIFTFSPATGSAPLLVIFNALNMDPAYGYLVDFGDGSTPAYGGNGGWAHTYASAGRYEATLYKCFSVVSTGVCSDKRGVGTAHVTVTAPAPTATLTLNGSTNVTLNVGDRTNFVWSSTGATSATSYFTVTPSTCPHAAGTSPYVWVANTLNGSSYPADGLSPIFAGCTYTITYVVTAANGQTASATVVEKVNMPNPSTMNSDAQANLAAAFGSVGSGLGAVWAAYLSLFGL